MVGDTSNGRRLERGAGVTHTDALTSAKLVLSTAQADLENVMGALDAAPRSDKVGVSKVVEGALDRLRSARAELEHLEQAVDPEAVDRQAGKNDG